MSPHEVERARIKRLRSVFEHLPNLTNFRRPARAHVRMLPKKGSAGHRPIMKFDYVDKARQGLLRSTFKPFMSFHDGQHMLARADDRRGPAAARKALLCALGQCDEDHVFMHIDVADFYGSISHEWLERNLGIDQIIVRRHVHLGQMILSGDKAVTTVHGHHEANREGGQRGIPQGSALSCLIAEHVMGDVLRSAAVFAEYPVVAWSDNVGVLVPRSEEARVAGLVRDAFAAHGAGPFKLGMLSSERVTEEFRFLGVYYRLSDGVAPVAFIPRPVVDAWELSVGSRLLHASLDEVDQIVSHIAGKKAAWGWWRGWTEVEGRLMHAVSSARTALERMLVQPVATLSVPQCSSPAWRHCSTV